MRDLENNLGNICMVNNFEIDTIMRINQIRPSNNLIQ